MTLVVNLFGGPGISKSTTTALVYGKLKIEGVNAEIVTEFAKDLTWEGRTTALAFQPYVAAKQMYRIHRLLDKVDVIVTDSPILLSAVYKGESYTPSFEAFLFDTFNSWDTMNIELARDSVNHAYNSAGRSQTEKGAMELDEQIDRMLHHHGVPHWNLRVREGEKTANKITEMVQLRLAGTLANPPGQVGQIAQRKMQKLSVIEQMLSTTP